MTNTTVNRDVATELLCTPGIRMTNRERKNLKLARETDVTPKRFDALGIEHRLEYRLGQRNWGQLCKWHKRATARRKDIQAKVQTVVRRQAKLGAKTGPPADAEIQELLALNQLFAALNARGSVIETFLNGVEEEIALRQKLWESVAKAGAPEFAKLLKKSMQNRVQKPAAV